MNDDSKRKPGRMAGTSTLKQRWTRGDFNLITSFLSFLALSGLVCLLLLAAQQLR